MVTRLVLHNRQDLVQDVKRGLKKDITIRYEEIEKVSLELRYFFSRILAKVQDDEDSLSVKRGEISETLMLWSNPEFVYVNIIDVMNTEEGLKLDFELI